MARVKKRKSLHGISSGVTGLQGTFAMQNTQERATKLAINVAGAVGGKAASEAALQYMPAGWAEPTKVNISNGLVGLLGAALAITSNEPHLREFGKGVVSGVAVEIAENLVGTDNDKLLSGLAGDEADFEQMAGVADYDDLANEYGTAGIPKGEAEQLTIAPIWRENTTPKILQFKHY